MVVSLDAYRRGKSYSVTRAARLAGTSSQNVRRWLRGYDYKGRHMEPVFARPESEAHGPLALSFLELAEIIVVARLRDAVRGITLQRVRDAHEYASSAWGLEYPFASQRFKTLGGHVIHEFESTEEGPPSSAIAISTGGREAQWVLPALVEQALELFDFDDEEHLASRWYPAGRDVRLIVDPRFGGGRMTITGRGVTVETIADRFQGGEDPEFIAEDLDVDVRDVIEAIRYSSPAAA